MKRMYDPIVAEFPCPQCGGVVEQDSDCPGYGTPAAEGGRGVMVCYPPCGNAQLYQCVGTTNHGSSSCGWWLRVPNNESRTKRHAFVRGEWTLNVAMGEPPIGYVFDGDGWAYTEEAWKQRELAREAE